MRYTLEQISRFSRLLAEQSRKYKNIGMVSGKSVVDSDEYMLGYEFEEIRKCLESMWMELQNGTDPQNGT